MPWKITTEPSQAHLTWAHHGRFGFSSPGWAVVLKNLGAQVYYAWSEKYEVGLVIPVFSRLTFRVGFLGFPITGEALDALSEAQVDELRKILARSTRIDALRITRPCCVASHEPFDAARPDIWLEDLTPRIFDRPKIRQDLAFAHRRALGFRIEPRLVNAADCYEIYSSTVKKHGGSVKYRQRYFESLSALCDQSADFTARAMVDTGGRALAFAVMVRNGTWGYYLHAGAEPSAKRNGAGDLLLEALLTNALTDGCRHFSLMASPWQQPGLIKFKEKWGDRRGLSITKHFYRGLRGRILRRTLSWQMRADRMAANNWLRSDDPKV